MKKYIVIGNPIEHSLSPKLHNYWMDKNNIKASYDKKLVYEEEFARALAEDGSAASTHITPKVYLYPTPENSTDVIKYYALTRIQDAGDYTNTMEITFRFLPCLTAGLAYYIAMKRAPDRLQLLKTVYDEEWDRAASEDIDSVSSKFLPPRMII